MKFRVSLIILTIIFILAGCESNLTQPPQELTYNGITVSESVPEFIQPSVLAKTTDESAAQIEEDPPYGTVYGHETDPDNVYLSSGSEVLPSGSWTDQVYDETYKTTLYANTKATFDAPTTVTITDPVDCYYLNASGVWVEVTSDTTVETTAIKTGLNGTCTIESDVKCTFPGDGGENG